MMVKIFFGTLISLLLITFGAYAIEEEWTKDCDAMGMFRHKDTVYQCTAKVRGEK
jgi:hypothetical protein